MKTSFAPSNRWPRAVRLGVAVVVGTVFLAAWTWGLREAASVHAGPATLYVDWATGSDTTDCTSYAGPCAAIGYALGQAGDGDTILVAEGDYTENLVITKEGNISEAPRFVDPSSGDYHLRSDSPAIDAGTNESAPETDLEGDRRPAHPPRRAVGVPGHRDALRLIVLRILVGHGIILAVLPFPTESKMNAPPRQVKRRQQAIRAHSGMRWVIPRAEGLVTQANGGKHDPQNRRDPP